MNKIDMGWSLDNSYLKLPEAFYSKVKLNPVSSAKLVILNHSLATSLGLNIEELQSKEGIDILAGNKAVEGGIPIAQAYAGHQFGHFTMLGDGRAILVGEQITPVFERFDIQLKGSGRTHYSRGGDGRATLGPMLREYIISEAMYNLGIPTTRGLAVVTTGDLIRREKQLPGAILTRVASSHIRVGTFQYASAQKIVRELADYSINRHFPYIKSNDNPYLSLLKEVIQVQASLIAKWQLVGFIHGVMNTDNMTISGETIDYGPCAFMDTYYPGTVFSSIDRGRRYAYENQPGIGEWNLIRFAETLLPLIHKDENESIRLAQNAMKDFRRLYYDNWLNGMRLKLGISDKEVEDKTLIEELLDLMEKYKADYTNTFIGLTFHKIDGTDLFNSEEFKAWYNKWEDRLERQGESKGFIQELMENNNPAIIPRNHLIERALELAVNNGNYEVFQEFLDILSEPYNHSKAYGKYAEVPEPTLTPFRTFCGT